VQRELRIAKHTSCTDHWRADMAGSNVMPGGPRGGLEQGAQVQQVIAGGAAPEGAHSRSRCCRLACGPKRQCLQELLRARRLRQAIPLWFQQP
jgi:hypothetical protein